MESEWSSNVWDLGIGSLGATLCARVLTAANWYQTNAPNQFSGPGRIYFEYPPTGDSPYGFGEYVPPLEHPNFPYGLDVA